MRTPMILLLAATALPALAAEPRWELKYRETFEGTTIPSATWKPEDLRQGDAYSDQGSYFTSKNPAFKVPQAFRSGVEFGQDHWLHIESYTRSASRRMNQMYSIVSDPAGGHNHALQIHSEAHTDATELRSNTPLPAAYKICTLVGYADFGTGLPAPDTNGYKGDEMAGPWVDHSSTNENGFYWLAILMSPPRPHNNVWIHHQRKVVIDSDNNWYPASEGGSWTRIFNGRDFVVSGEHPVMAFVLDRDHKDKVYNYDRTGQPFISMANGQWNSEAETGQIRAVDAYKDRTWYEACIEKTPQSYGISVAGDFKYGGKRKYENSIDAAKVFTQAGARDYFMMGDPHINYYRGTVYYDDVRLWVPR
ncbi:MAG TPA: hypothetical protein VL588_04050 [Bdellovibrionota bacterium]|jgi:hypothetical protein|nr:hypothetical protein [Bdellovibrionota bacterium]